MRILLVALLLAAISTCIAQPFSDQDRFGKSYSQVATHTHADWIAWYCDPARAGQNGRVVGEKIYAIALDHQNRELLATRPKADRDYFNDLQLKFANMAKYACTISHAAHGQWEGMSLTSAQVGTSLNRSVQDIILARPASVKPDVAKVRAAFEAGQKRLNALKLGESEKKYVGDHYPAMGKMIEQLMKEFGSRSAADKAILNQFCLYMIEIASLDR